MDKNGAVQVLTAVLNTLDHISIHGRENVENMHGCMVALSRLVDELIQTEMEAQNSNSTVEKQERR